MEDLVTSSKDLANAEIDRIAGAVRRLVTISAVNGGVVTTTTFSRLRSALVAAGYLERDWLDILQRRDENGKVWERNEHL